MRCVLGLRMSLPARLGEPERAVVSSASPVTRRAMGVFLGVGAAVAFTFID